MKDFYLKTFKTLLYSLIWLIISFNNLCIANTNQDSIYIKKAAVDFINSRITDIQSEKKGILSELKQVYVSDDSCNNKVYVFSMESGGYVFALDADTSVIIPAWSLEGNFDPSNPTLIAFLRAYESSPISIEKGSSPISKGSITPLLGSENIIWSQSGVYNDACPWDADANSHTLAGCVAVAMAQIMRYHKHPATGNGTHSYTHQKYGLITADFGATTYKWNLMPGSISESNADVAQVLFHAGVSTDMNYTPGQSGAFSKDVAPALRNYFRYPNATFVNRDHFSSETGEYHDVLRHELENNRPFYFALTGGNNEIGWGGHAVVVDGFDEEYFHINFGWGGSDNGYFLFSGTTVLGSYQFGFNGNAVIQISPVPVQANVQDSLALVALYNSTGGANWTNKTNWLTDRVSTWYGVTMIDGRVVHVILDNNNLTGSLPATISDLTALTSLNLTGNKLTGSIPVQYGNLTNLVSLTLSFNQLTGSIPATIGNCTDLRILQLGSNKLEGSIPAALGNLSLLERFMVGSNNLSGSLPETLCNLVALKSLDLSDNKFIGNLPANLGNMSLLTHFQVNKNQFSGEIPESISEWPGLTMFSIDDNLFEGPVPSGIKNFTNLIILTFDNNRFTSLPEEISNLTSLTRISAKNNRLGTLPAGIGSLTNLVYLELNNNLIQNLPSDIGKLVKLEKLNLENNLLEILPPEMGGLTSLTTLDLTGNLLTELPYEISNMINLTNLLVTHNRLTDITFGISLMGKLAQAEFSYNHLNSPLPPLSHQSLPRFNIDHNNLTFEHIASSKLPDDVNYYDNYDFYYQYQGSVKLNTSKVEYSLNDSVGVDIRSLAGFSHPGNVYTWFKNGTEFSAGPLLVIKNATASTQGKYFCSVENTSYTKLTLNTDTLILSMAQAENQITDTIVSRSGSPLSISDEMVKLVKPAGLRGDLTWQSSLDSVNWTNLTGTITNQDIARNIMNISPDSIIISPSKAALYRYMVTEGECDPLFSDTILIGPYKSRLLIDTMLNVDNSSATVSLEKIEIFIPLKLTKGDFRLTINLIETPPMVPDSVKNGPVYDVKLSFGTSFTMPITIKMKVDSDSLLPGNIDRFIAVFHDDKEYKWIPYEGSSISVRDSSIIFETNHLTKLGWWEKKWIGGHFTDKFERDSVTVYYQQRFAYLSQLYDQNQSAKSWHLPPTDPEYETPLMIQDVAQFTLEVMRKFKLLGLSVPRSITIYVDDIEDFGVVGLMGMTNGYITVSVHIEDPDLLRSVIAHEYMHYTQDYYILAHPGNIFWMEANGHTADRMVWNTNILPVSESDAYLLKNRKGKNTIFQSIAESWDFWDSGLLTQNLLGNVDYCYLAGSFIHYMRSYRPGTKLKPETLLKETPTTGSWKDYLDSYTSTYLSSTIGKEYEEFIKYIISGTNHGYTLLNNSPQASGDPLRFINQAPEKFSKKHLYKIADNETNITPILETIKQDMPYLSSRMEHFYNLSLNRSLCVSYKRTHNDTTNMKVYLGIWDEPTKTIKLTDISRKDSSFFFIEAASPDNVEVKANQAFLLFINRSNDLTIEAGYELEVLPVADFNFLYTLDFSYGNTMDAPIHNFSDAINRRILMVFNSEAENLNKIYTDSSFTTTVSDGIRTQQVYYNFRNGNLILSEERVRSGPVSFDPSGCIYNYENETTVVTLKNIFLVPFSSEYVSQSGIYYTQTASTNETISKFVSITNVYNSTCDLSGGGTSTYSYTYSGTNWSISPDIRINLQFK